MSPPVSLNAHVAASVVGGSHMTQEQEDATNPLLTTALPDGKEKRAGR